MPPIIAPTTAVDDFLGVHVNHVLNLNAANGLLSNDTNASSVAAVNGQTANVGQSINLDSGASLTVNSDGSLTYTPPSHEDLNDYFTYTATDGINFSQANVFVSVWNNQPTRFPGRYHGHHGRPYISCGHGGERLIASHL